MHHIVVHFFKLFSKALESEAFDDSRPTEFVRFGAVLDTTELVVELQAPRTRFAIAKLVRLAVFGVVDARDRANDGSGTTCASLFEGSQFLFSDGTTLDLHADAFSQLHQALVSDGRQDGRALRRDVGIVLDTKEVGSASLVNILLFLGVEIELAGVLAAVAGLNVRTQRSGVVATHL